ncbi:MULTISPECIES: hypothetical protein [Klebsiella pneumoniae complex]|uniref:hypothetical protein n=1 Tax=Klebsiella pneumoniae complex TaxID=3390273 RepID=UPI0007A4286D|nr:MULTISPECIES: hypothetical protein [Klebsiella]HCU2164306.1 hypothetical protein [Klebsiella quasipneumoniae]MDP1345941.1 hypothetical protein [Klebsiella pneumoniae]SVX76079.1 Uncharacterised protein [Klebsiella pneumoniae]SWD84092.1 Uncharacterised protein [Klebsiella pneumoniae]VUG74157.1 Uncharacterised protein [Klebsiella pneumoniae]
MSEQRFISKIQDTRVDCWSALVEFDVNDYLMLAEKAYVNRGGIRHQREALKTTTAKRIRTRLVEDLRRGAVIPPLVIGIVADDDDWQSIDAIVESDQVKELLKKYYEDLSIIDGMQRTTALKEALALDGEVASHAIRVEAWIAKGTESLIYRMLVLNTGQVPWNLKQQLEVVYAPLVKTIGQKVKFRRLLSGSDRRWQGGEFKTDALIESYIAFGLRRTEVDTQESLADEFSRLDIAEALTNKKYDHYFYRVVQMLVNFDIALSKYNEVTNIDNADPSEGSDSLEIGIKARKLVRGRNIFDTQAARVGFIVACAVSILGRVGMDKEEEVSEERCAALEQSCGVLVQRINALTGEDLEAFLLLDVLAEKLSRRPSSAVGRWERSFFESAFRVLVEENFNVPNMEPCWRA